MLKIKHISPTTFNKSKNSNNKQNQSLKKIILIFFFLYVLSKFLIIKDKYFKIKSDKWIVLYTINPPSPTIDFFSKNLMDWKIIIIGDEETNDDNWNKYNTSKVIIYLSLKEQKSLGYKSLKYISKRSYSRKNIGYLFAIQHGAKEIYEIDDDIVINNIKDVNITFNKDKYSRISIGINNSSKMINPYSYFGINDIWPRGFLLNDISFNNNEFFNYAFTQIKIKPLIYQGLINGEPDTDEIFIETRKNKKSPLHILFTDNNPLLYIPGNYIPINSKNTKYYYEIFPSLPFFSSLNNKINDIFRGYIMQTYAWKYKGGVIFLPFNTYKFGNFNKNINLIKEKKIYFDTKNFLNVLKDIINEESNPKEFLINIIRTLVKKKILKNNDLKIFLSFIDDLSAFNYIYSTNYNKREIIDINYKKYLNIYSEFSYSQIFQGQIFIMNKKGIKLIKHKSSNKVYTKILLIIIYNYAKLIILNRYMMKLYRRYFPNMIFLKEGFNNMNKNDIIECKESSKGFYSYMCFREVYIKYPNMKGYLFIDDDNFVKPWDLDNLDFNIPWMNTIKKHFNTSKNPKIISSLWKRLNNTYVNTNYLLNKNLIWKKNYFKFYGSSDIINVLVDIVYIPNMIMNKFCDLVESMYESRIFIQTAIPTAFGIMLLKKIHILTSIFLWERKRKRVIYYLRRSYSIGVHPIKFSNNYYKILANEYIEFIRAIEY